MSEIRFDDQFHTLVSRCIRCGQCTYGDEEIGYELLCPIYKRYKFFSYSPGGIVQIARALYEGKIEASSEIKDIVYKCTTCGVCEEACGVVSSEGQTISPMKVAGLLKYELVKRGIDPPKPLTTMCDNVLKDRSPFGSPHEKRLDWLSPEMRERLSDKPQMMYFVGCTTSYLETDIAKSFSGLLEKAGVDFTIGKEEWCCGMPLYMAGRMETLQELVEHNVELIEATGVEEVVFTCPGCYYTFKVFYPKWLGKPLPFAVTHATEFIEKNVNRGKIGLKNGDGLKVTYHDPCHLGRLMGVYEQPRKILNAVPGLSSVEMERTMDNAWCCGAGGGVKAAFNDFALWAARERLEEAKATGSELLLTACPFCELNLKGSAGLNKEYPEVRDIFEFVYEKLKT